MAFPGSLLRPEIGLLIFMSIVSVPLAPIVLEGKAITRFAFLYSLCPAAVRGRREHYVMLSETGPTGLVADSACEVDGLAA